MKSKSFTSIKLHRIVKCLKQLGLRQIDIATFLNISPQRVSNVYAERDDFTNEQLSLLCEKYKINLNWVFTGNGDMFMESETVNLGGREELKTKFNLTDDDMDGLMELLESGASRDMVLKFIQVKKGNKEALEALIQNLNGVKAAYNFWV